jgi:ferritin-like metal-binding protein YciE
MPAIAPQASLEHRSEGERSVPRHQRLQLRRAWAAATPPRNDPIFPRLVFEKLGRKPSATQCPAIEGKEADEVAGEVVEDRAILDAALIASAQAVEHYEMCRYGTLVAWAEKLGHDDVVRFLTTNLNEETATNSKLNTIAMRKVVNTKAVNAA